MAAMATDLPQAEPSEGLRDRLRAAVEETEQLPLPEPAPEPALERPIADQPPSAARRATGFPFYDSPRPVPDGRPAWRRVLPTALIAAAVAAILGLGAWNVTLATSRDELAAQASQQSAIVKELLSPGHATIAPMSDTGGKQVATVVARPGRVFVVSQGLTVNDRSNSVYVVWGMTGDQTIPLGTFDVITTQTDLRTVGSGATGLDQYGAYALSIEPGRKAPSAPTEVVATGQVTS
jgi:hypothetical protein